MFQERLAFAPRGMTFVKCERFIWAALWQEGAGEKTTSLQLVMVTEVAIAGVEHDGEPWDCDVASSFDY